MGRGLFEGWHIVVLLVLLVVLFGFRRLPDAARSVGRSMRVFKSEMTELKNDGNQRAEGDTVKGETVEDDASAGKGGDADDDTVRPRTENRSEAP